MIQLKEACKTNTCCELLKELRQQVPAVRSASWGSNVVNSPSSFDFCFVLEFDDLEGLAAYDTSDHHQLLRQEIRSIRAASHTVDYFDTL